MRPACGVRGGGLRAAGCRAAGPASPPPLLLCPRRPAPAFPHHPPPMLSTRQLAMCLGSHSGACRLRAYSSKARTVSAHAAAAVEGGWWPKQLIGKRACTMRLAHAHIVPGCRHHYHRPIVVITDLGREATLQGAQQHSTVHHYQYLFRQC